jgi:curli biogenesis system outer membrane secretion channel CsgG
MKKMSLLTVLVLVVMTSGFTYAAKIPTVIVAPFKNSSQMRLQSTESITDNFISILMDTRRFNVLERERLKDVTEEMVSKGQLSVKNADYAFLNNLSTLDLKVSKYKVPLVDVVQEKAVVKVQVNVRVVDIDSSKILFSATGKAQQEKKATQGALGLVVNNERVLDNALVNDAIREALEDVVLRIADNLFPIKIIGIKKGKIYLNRGKPAGIELGQVYEVYMKGEELVDSDTGLSLGAEEEKIGVIKVVDAREKYSIGKVIEGKITSENKGAVCRKPVVQIGKAGTESKKKKKKKIKLPW